jgi:hypothetical protein
MMFLVVVRRSGPEWDRSKPLEEQSGWDEHAAFMDGLVDDGVVVLGGPLSDEERVAHAVQAESEDDPSQSDLRNGTSRLRKSLRAGVAEFGSLCA